MCILKLFVIVCLFVAGISESVGLINSGECTRPNGDVGDCVDVRECESETKLLQSFGNKTRPSYLYDDLRKLQCGASITSVKICCPRKERSLKPDESLPLDTCGKSDDGDRVSFGNKTELFEYPWMVQLAYKTENGIEYLCGGTLINDKYVLTAGHCVPRNGYRKLIYARLGEHDMSSPIDCADLPFQGKVCAPEPQDIEIESQIFHPHFDRVELLNDIALLRLKQKADTSVDSVTPICLPVLPKARNGVLGQVIVTGWGLTENNTRSNVLLQGSVAITNKEDCKKLYKNINVTEAQICIGDDTNVASCQGDSGGPIQIVQDFNGDTRYVQYGIVSQGPTTCGADGLPGIHTRIEFYLDWLISNIKP